MDLEKLATNFGLPGLLIAVFYLLIRAQNERAAKADDRKLAIDEKRIDAMFAQANAMATGFTALVQAMANNHAADIESHSELASAIAELKGKVDEAIAWRTETTPIGPPPKPPGRAATQPGSQGFYGPRKGARDEDG